MPREPRSIRLTWVTRLFDTSTTVTGTASPSSVNRRIMPTLRPSNPKRLLRLIVFSRTSAAATSIGHGVWMRKRVDQASVLRSNEAGAKREALHYKRTCLIANGARAPRCPNSEMGPGRGATKHRPGAHLLLQLDLHVDAGRQVELHQRVDGLVGRVDDVHQALVRADLELVAAGLVHVRRAQDVEALHARRQRHRALDDRAGALRGVDDRGGRLVDQLVVERLQPDADFLFGCHGPFTP